MIDDILTTPALELNETIEIPAMGVEKLDSSNENQENIVKKAMSATEISNKIHKPATYKEVISDLIYFQC